MKPEMDMTSDQFYLQELDMVVEWLDGLCFQLIDRMGPPNGPKGALIRLRAVRRHFQDKSDNARPASPEDEGIDALANYAPFRKDGRSDPARAAERSARSKRVWAKKRATAKKGKR